MEIEEEIGSKIKEKGEVRGVPWLSRTQDVSHHHIQHNEKQCDQSFEGLLYQGKLQMMTSEDE